MSYETSSDRRLKTNIQEMETMVEKICALKPCKYKWLIGDEQEDYGLIAQEVYQVFPHMKPDISTYQTNDDCCLDEENPTCDDCSCNETIPYYYSLDYGKFTPYLIKAIQEQQKEINLLKTKLADEEAKTNYFELKINQILSHLDI